MLFRVATEFIREMEEQNADPDVENPSWVAFYNLMNTGSFDSWKVVVGVWDMMDPDRTEDGEVIIITTWPDTLRNDADYIWTYEGDATDSLETVQGKFMHWLEQYI